MDRSSPTTDKLPLGFGTSSLAKNSTVRSAVRNLHTAFDEGITHFDTAPAYCFGHAEMLLGKFIGSRRDQVTVTTKYGITPRRIPFSLLPVFNLVRTPLKRLLATAVRVSGSKHHHAFTYTSSIDPDGLIGSLENSLTELKTDYVDNFMLHRIDSSLANQEDVVARLLKARDAGKIRRLGMAGSFADIYEGEPLGTEYTAIQFGDQIDRKLAASISHDHSGRVYYRFGIFSLLGSATAYLRERNETDITAVELCMAYFRRDQDFGITLFSSSKDKNIRDVVKKWQANRPVSPELYAGFNAYVAANVNE